MEKARAKGAVIETEKIKTGHSPWLVSPEKVAAYVRKQVEVCLTVSQCCQLVPDRSYPHPIRYMSNNIVNNRSKGSDSWNKGKQTLVGRFTREKK